MLQICFKFIFYKGRNNDYINLSLFVKKTYSTIKNNVKNIVT